MLIIYEDVYEKGYDIKNSNRVAMDIAGYFVYSAENLILYKIYWNKRFQMYIKCPHALDSMIEVGKV